MRPLIIGCGNPDRGDDAAGVLAARRLREFGQDAIEHTGDGLALISLWQGREDVVIIDAAAETGEPVHRTTHTFGVADGIELARALGLLPARLRVIPILGRRFDMGTPVSKEVAAAIDAVVADLRE